MGDALAADRARCSTASLAPPSSSGEGKGRPGCRPGAEASTPGRPRAAGSMTRDGRRASGRYKAVDALPQQLLDAAPLPRRMTVALRMKTAIPSSNSRRSRRDDRNGETAERSFDRVPTVIERARCRLWARFFGRRRSPRRSAAPGSRLVFGGRWRSAPSTPCRSTRRQSRATSRIRARGGRAGDPRRSQDCRWGIRSFHPARSSPECSSTGAPDKTARAAWHDGGGGASPAARPVDRAVVADLHADQKDRHGEGDCGS